MTPEKIAELRALCNEASKPPWKAGPISVSAPEEGCAIYLQRTFDGICHETYERWKADAAFIAAARTALPEALDEIERLRAEIDDLRNGDGLEFSFVAHAKAELAKRDVIIDALYNEIERLTK